MGQEYKIDFRELKYDFLLARVNVRKEFLRVREGYLREGSRSIYLPYGYILYWFDGIGNGKKEPDYNSSCIENILDAINNAQEEAHEESKNIELCCVRPEPEITVPFGFRYADWWLISGSVKCKLDIEKLIYDFFPKSWRLLSVDGLNFELLSEYYIDSNDETKPQKGVSVELREVFVSALEEGLKNLMSEELQQQDLEERIRVLLSGRCSLPEAIKECTLISVHVKKKEEGHK